MERRSAFTMEDGTRPGETPFFASAFWNIPFPAPCQMPVFGASGGPRRSRAAIDFFRSVW
jgi:hypothetical protein